MHLNPCKRQRIATKAKVEELPEDMLVDILVKLPVKSLVRFRWVCKSWLSLITHPRFVREHLIYHHQNPHNEEADADSDGWCVLKIDADHWPYNNKDRIYLDIVDEAEDIVDEAEDLVDVMKYNCSKWEDIVFAYGELFAYGHVFAHEEEEDVEEEEEEKEKEEEVEQEEEEIDCPSILREAIKFTVCSQCDGLLCVAVKMVERVALIVWNPSLREYIELPPTPHPKIFDSLHGIGYDPHSQDYKVVRISQGRHRMYCKPAVHVLALKTQVWKRVRNAPPILCMDEAIPLNGSLYWTGESGLILRFDLVTEKFSVVLLHVYKTWCWSKLVNIRGSLCLAGLHSKLDEFVRVWSLSPKDVWNRLLTTHASSFLKSCTPPGFTWSSAFILRLLCRSYIKLQHNAFFIKKPDSDTSTQVFCYKESLVSPSRLLCLPSEPSSL